MNKKGGTTRHPLTISGSAKNPNVKKARIVHAYTDVNLHRLLSDVIVNLADSR